MSQQLPTSKSLDSVRDAIDDIQSELEVACAELGLTHGALERNVPPQHKTGDVAWAIAQNAAVERKVQQAAEDLEQVQDLLERVRTAASA